MSLAATSDFFLTNPTWPQPASQQLFPDAIATQTNIGGTVGDIDEDPDSPDANWMAGTGAIVLRVTFPTPSANLLTLFNQEFRVRARPGT